MNKRDFAIGFFTGMCVIGAICAVLLIALFIL